MLTILYWRWNQGFNMNKHDQFHLPRWAVFRSTGSSRFRRVDKEAADPARIISSVNISTCKRRFLREKQREKMKDRKQIPKIHTAHLSTPSSDPRYSADGCRISWYKWALFVSARRVLSRTDFAYNAQWVSLLLHMLKATSHPFKRKQRNIKFWWIFSFV